jgi:hypothetical protein
LGKEECTDEVIENQLTSGEGQADIEPSTLEVSF